MRVAQLEQHYGDAVDVVWRSFMLRSEPKASSLDKFIAYTGSWGRCAETEPAARFTFPWASGANPPSSSLPAQVGWKAAGYFGPRAQRSMHERLLDAYFCDNRDISNPDVVADVAAADGIDRDEFKAVVTESGAELAQQVVDDHDSALRRGITAVPTVVLGGRFPVPGAQPLETYVRLVDRMLGSAARR